MVVATRRRICSGEDTDVDLASTAFATLRYPPVTLMWRAKAGTRLDRSMMKSWPLGLRVSRLAWRDAQSELDRRQGEIRVDNQAGQSVYPTASGVGRHLGLAGGAKAQGRVVRLAGRAQSAQTAQGRGRGVGQQARPDRLGDHHHRRGLPHLHLRQGLIPIGGNALERRTQAQEFGERDNEVMNDTARRSKTIGHSAMGQEPKARPLDREPRVVGLHQGQRTQSAPRGRTYDRRPPAVHRRNKNACRGAMVWTPPSRRGGISNVNCDEGGYHAGRSDRSRFGEVCLRGSRRKSFCERDCAVMRWPATLPICRRAWSAWRLRTGRTIGLACSPSLAIRCS
jgi:hypothetical protein